MSCRKFDELIIIKKSNLFVIDGDNSSHSIGISPGYFVLVTFEEAGESDFRSSSSSGGTAVDFRSRVTSRTLRVASDTFSLINSKSFFFTFLQTWMIINNFSKKNLANFYKTLRVYFHHNKLQVITLVFKNLYDTGNSQLFSGLEVNKLRKRMKSLFSIRRSLKLRR